MSENENLLVPSPVVGRTNGLILVTVYGFKGLPAFGGAVGDQGSGVQGCMFVSGLHF